MSLTVSLGARLRRLERAFDESQSSETGYAERLKRARAKVEETKARGAVRQFFPIDVSTRLDFESRRSGERLNGVGVRMYRHGHPGYDAFAELSAQSTVPHPLPADVEASQ